jgi:hypothetical protein
MMMVVFIHYRTVTFPTRDWYKSSAALRGMSARLGDEKIYASGWR